MKRSFSFFLLFFFFLISLVFLSACTITSQQMPPFKELHMKVSEQQSFQLGGHAIFVRYLQAEPTHLVEIDVDGTVRRVNIEEYKVCPEEKVVTKKIIDNQGNYVGAEKVIEQEPCWYAWQEGELSFVTFLDKPDTLLRLSVSLPPKQGDYTL